MTGFGVDMAVQHHRPLATWLTPGGPKVDDLPKTEAGWSKLAENARRAGLAGLLLERADRRGITIPGPCGATLRDASMVVAADHLAMRQELVRLLTAFDSARLPVMLLKGAALNLTIYDRPDLRPMGDLDLLVRPESANDALELLADLGCRRGFDLIREGFFPKYHYEVEFLTGTHRPVRIDLHVRPFRPLRIARTMGDDALWPGAKRVRFGDGQAVIPRPEFMFIHLAAHAAFHGCSRLLWLHDIQRLVERSGSSMDWRLVLRSATRWRLSLAVLRAVETCGGLWGPLCPPEVLGDLGSHRASWRDRWTLRQAPRDADSPLIHVLCNALCTPGFALPFGYLVAHLFPGAKHLAGIYPFRHRGWLVAAHAWRCLRGVARMFARPCRSVLRIRIGRSLPHSRFAGRSATAR